MQISSNSPQLTPIDVTSDASTRSALHYSRPSGADTARPKLQTQLRERPPAHAASAASSRPISSPNLNEPEPADSRLEAPLNSIDSDFIRRRYQDPSYVLAVEDFLEEQQQERSATAKRRKEKAPSRENLSFQPVPNPVFALLHALQSQLSAAQNKPPSVPVHRSKPQTETVSPSHAVVSPVSQKIAGAGVAATASNKAALSSGFALSVQPASGATQPKANPLAVSSQKAAQRPFVNQTPASYPSGRPTLPGEPKNNPNRPPDQIEDSTICSVL